MKTPNMSVVGRFAARSVRCAALFGSAAWLLCSLTPAHAAPTRQELIDYAKTTWELTDLTDDVISQTLDTSYSGIPYKDYVSYFVVAPSVLNPLLSGDYKTAGKKAADFAADQSISFLLKEAGLSGVFAPARLAAWPIEQGLNSFQNAVKEASFKNQILLYFAARSAGNSYGQIVALQEFDLLAADPDILKNNRDLVMKIRYGDGQLWLAYSTSYLVGSVRGYTPEQFYDYAEQQWQSFVATKNYAAHQAIVKDAFRAAASPQKPVITQQPQDAVIPTGQDATFTVAATGGPFTYVWRFNGSVIPLATSASLTANAAGQYQVEVSNAGGTTPSRIATLTVNAGEPVAITAPAASAIVSGNIAVRASVSGATKVEFYLDGVRQFTDSSTPFTWTWNTAIAANGSHALTAKAYNGATLLGTSAAVNVTVNNAAPPPCSDPNEPNNSSPTATPLSVGVAANGYVCTATDVDWFKMEVTMPGVLTFDLTVPVANDYDIELFGPDYLYIKGSYRDTGLAENITHNAISTGTYYVRVYGYPVGNGSHNTTTPYALTASTASGPVTIVTPLQNRTVPAGANASFSVVASGALPLAYQWQRDNTDIPGATGPTYTTSALTVSDSGAQFRVRVTNAFGFVISAPASLTVNSANVITWTGAVSGDWNNRTNWNPMSVPTATDVVQLNSGDLSVPTGAAFGVLNFNGGALYGNFTNTGTLNWTSGTLRGRMTVGTSGVLNLTGGADKNLDANQGATLVNAGVVNWTGGNLVSLMPCGFGSFPVTVSNLASGVFNMQTDTAIITSGCSYWNISNAGLLRKIGSSGTNVWNYGVNVNNIGTIDVQSGTLNLTGSLTSSGLLNVTSGAGVVVASGNQSFTTGATLNIAAGANVAYLSGGVTFAPGVSVTGTGSNRVTGGVSFNGTVNLPNFELVSGNLYGDFTNAGTLNWMSGTLAGRMMVAAGGVLNLTGGADKNLDANQSARLVNAGVVNWTGGNLVSQMPCGFGSFPVTVSNLVGGVFNIQTDTAIVTSGCSYWNIYNAGLLRKTGSSGTNVWSYGVNVSNTGTVNVQNGTLNLTGSLTSSGLLNVASGAGVVVASGNQNFTAGATLNIATGANVAYLSGGVTFSPGVSVTGAGSIRVTGGVSFNGIVNLPNFELASGNLYGDFTNAGTLNWTSGTLAGRMMVGPGGVLNLVGSADKNLDANQSARLINAGVVNWTGGNLVSLMPCGFGSFPVTVSNLASGVFNIQTDTAIVTSGCSYWNIYNAGLLRKTGSSGTNVWSYGVNVNNTGTVDVQNGTLNLTGSLTSSGVLNVASGAGMVVASGNQNFTTGATVNIAAGANVAYVSGGVTFAPGVSVTGAGSNRVTGGVSFNGTVNLPNFELVSGNLYGDFTNAGTLNWTSGTLAGRMTVSASGVLNLTGGADKNLDANQSARLVNAGVVNWTGGNLVSLMPCGFGSFPVTVSNLASGVFNVQTDTAIVTSGCSYWNISNAGLLRKTGSGGTNAWSSGVNFNNTGTLDIQSGTLNFNNGFTQTAAGTLQMELGGLTPGSGFGRLVVNSQATLAGALNVTLINGFTPQFGDAFSILSYNSRSGNFASINLPALPNALALTAQYNSTNLALLTINGGGNNQTNTFQITRASNGLPELRFTGEPNRPYRLQASTNLVDWLDISTNTPVNGLLRFVDPNAASMERRFYRAVSP